jgi:PAS domain S-box-containing protein
MSLTDLIIGEPTVQGFQNDNVQVSEKLWKTIFEQSPIGFALWDRELKNVRINKALATMNGFPEQTYLSKNVLDKKKLISEETILLMQKVKETGIPVIGREITGNTTNNLNTQKTWLVSYHPFFENGKVEGVLASCEDITEKKRIEAENLRILEELRHRESRFDSLIKATATTYWSSNAEGEIIDDVPMWENLTGQSTADMQKLGWREVIHPEDVDETIRKWQNAVKTKKLYETEFRLRMKSGEYRYFVSRALPVLDSDGKVLEWVGVNVDINNQKHTDRKLIEAVAEREEILKSEQKARREAERANSLKDEFLATLSHELRTPLTAIIGWAKMLRTGQLAESEIIHALETIERNTEVQKQLIEDLLDVSAIASGKLRLELQPMSLIPVLKSALNTILPTAEIKQIQIIDNIRQNSGTIYADSHRIQQILWNLLTNAVKFTPRSGQISISLSEQNNNFEILISDNGIGIKPEIIDIIFDSFRQGDSKKTRSYGGLGLGLAIVRSLAEAHGGTIEAHSDGEGKGSTFTLCLPILSKSNHSEKPFEKTTAELPKVKQDDSFRLDNLRLLVVDDDDDNLDLLKTLLSHYGATVFLAKSAAEGLAFIKQSTPDILISDIGMPLEDGYQFIAKVRALPKDQGGEVPAIALTAFAKIEDCEKALSVGFQRHITKPIDPTDFVKVIAELAAETIKT